jgi:hypothetical protein
MKCPVFFSPPSPSPSAAATKLSHRHRGPSAVAAGAACMHEKESLEVAFAWSMIRFEPWKAQGGKSAPTFGRRRMTGLSSKR